MVTRVETRLYRGDLIMKTMDSDSATGALWSFADGETARADICERLIQGGVLQPAGDGLFPGMSQQYGLKPYAAPLETFITERFGADWTIVNRRTAKAREAHAVLILRREYAEAEREWSARSKAA